MHRIALAALLTTAVSLASAAPVTITWGVNGGDLAAGEIDLGDAKDSASYTWTNPGAAGFDVTLTNSEGTSGWDGEDPAGSIKTHGSADSTVTFEFFQTGTTIPVNVTGFRVMFGDLDSGGVGPAVDFTVTSFGVQSPLDVSLFDLGSDLSPADNDGDGITDDIASAHSESSVSFGYAPINAVVNTGSMAISSLSFQSLDYVHIGNATTSEMEIIPEPATLSLLAAGGLAGLVKRRRR